MPHPTTPDLRCPSCSAPMAGGPACGACGLPLVGPDAAALWDVDLRLLAVAARLADLVAATQALRQEQVELGERRHGLLARLRAAPVQPEPVTAGPAGPAALVGPALSHWSRPRGARAETRPRTGQQVLLTVGGLLLAVAATVFLAVSWSLLGLGGRACVLAGLTGVALYVARPLRARGLAATAEALTGVGVALLLLDVVAARRTGFLGLDAPSASDLAAGAGAACAGLLAGHARLLRTWTSGVAALLLAQVPGLALASAAQTPWGTLLPLAATALVDLVLAAVLVRPEVVGGRPLTRTATGALLLASLAWVAALSGLFGLSAAWPVAGAALLLAAVAAVAVLVPAARPVAAAPPTLTTLMLLVAGAAAATALGADTLPAAVAGCAAVGALLAGLTRLVPAPARARLLTPAAWTLAAATAVVWTMPLAALAQAVGGAARWGSQVWTHPLTGTVAATGGRTVAGSVMLAAAVPLTLLATWRVLPRAVPVGAAAASLLVVASLTPVAVDLPLVVTLALSLLTAGLLAGVSRARPGLVVPAGWGALVLALATAGWSLGSEVATPWTLAALTAGLLAATAVRPWRGAGAGLAVPAAAALVQSVALRAGTAPQAALHLVAALLVLPVAAALLARTPRRVHDALEVGAAATGLVVLTAAASAHVLGVRLLLVLPLVVALTVRADRRAVRIPLGSGLVVAVGLLVPWLLDAAPTRAAAVQAGVSLLSLAGAGIAACLAAGLLPAPRALPIVAAARTRDGLGALAVVGAVTALVSGPSSGVHLVVLVLTAGLAAAATALPLTLLPGARRAVTATLASLAWLGATAPLSALAGWGTGGSGLAPAVAAAAVAGVSALLAGRRPRERRCLEVVAAAGGLLALPAATTTASTLSWALAALGLGALAVGVQPDRRPVAVVGALLLSAAGWVRLADAGVSTPELYAAPVALLALLLGHLRRRRTGAGSWSSYGSGLSLLLGSSLFAALTREGDLRPALLAVAAAVVALVGARTRLQAPLAVGAVVLAADAVSRTAPWAAQVPAWIWAALIGSALLALGATYERRITDARRLRDGWSALA